jgi:LysR family hca operon transcriptional activator
MGFLTGHEVTWLPKALQILSEEQPNPEITLSSQSSPELVGALLRGEVDIAFLRRDQTPGLAFRSLMHEPLVAVLRADHPLAAAKAVRPKDLAGQIFIDPTKTAPTLKPVIDAYLKKIGLALTPAYHADNLAMATSLVSSTGGVTLLPLYAQNLLPPGVVIRPLEGVVPTVELVIGYSKANTSPILKRFLAKANELADQSR